MTPSPIWSGLMKPERNICNTNEGQKQSENPESTGVVWRPSMEHCAGWSPCASCNSYGGL